MKKKITILPVILILLATILTQASGATKCANVTLPAFDIRLNGVKIDNQSREYPLIVYKNITYFPMTYFDSMFLGLETIWDDNTGLKINVSEEFNGYIDNNLADNKSSYTATVIRFPVEINNKIIDNSNEEYPILLFRNVTYFPLTWKFAVDEFGWDYKFTDEMGLEINNSKFSGPQISEVRLPIAIRDNGDFIGAFTVAGNYFYYEGEDGIIYQAPLDNPDQRKSVYELPHWTYGNSYVYPSLETIDNHAMLSYHQGGAATGDDYKIILYDDGTNERFSLGYSNKVDFGNIIVNVDQWVPPYKNNMAVKAINEDEYKTIGNPDYIYGWVWSGSGGGRSNDLYLIGDEIYVLAYYKPHEEFGTTGIHKVNIKTGETIRLCDESAKKFIIIDDIVYFIDMDGYLYKIQLGQSTAEKLLDFPVSDFVVLNHQVYYVTNYDDGLELFKLGNSDSVNPGGAVKYLQVEGGYAACIFETSSSSSVKMMIINNKGNVIFETSDVVKYVKINNNKIFYIP